MDQQCIDPESGAVVAGEGLFSPAEANRSLPVCRPEDLVSQGPAQAPEPPRQQPAPRPPRRSEPMDGGVPMDAGPHDGMYDHLPAPPLESVDIQAVDDRDVTGWLAGAVRAGEVSGFDDAQEMVDRILEAADGHPLGTVDVDDHGSPGSQQMGNQRVTVEALQDPDTRLALERLGASFGPDGRLDLQGCRVAEGEQGEQLLRELARVTRVPVRGGVPYQRPLIPGYEGSVMTCEPPVVSENGTESQLCTVDGHPIMDDVWNWRPDR